MKRKLFSKIAVAALSMVACVTCFGVAANTGNVNGVADDAKVTLAGGTWNNVGNYSVAWGSTNTVTPNEPIFAETVTKTNSAGQTLKGIELSTNNSYDYKSTSADYTVKGFAMNHSQSLTVEIDDAIEMDETVEFYFAPYVHSGMDKYQERRFVMALSDTEGKVEPAYGSVTTYGFHSTGNFISWEFLQHYQWQNVPNGGAPEVKANGPHWYETSSSGKIGYGALPEATGYRTGVNNTAGTKITGSRMGSWALARAFYGAEETGKGPMLVKATMTFTETDLVLYFQGVYESNLTDIKCDKGHSINMADSAAACSTCCFKQTYKLADLGIEHGSALKLYMGYYNVWAQFGLDKGAYGELPMSLKLYNYKNGDVKSVTAKNETVSMKASESLTLADQVNVAYFDGGATADVTFTSNNDAVATIVDGKLVPVANTVGGNVTVTATAGGKTATFTVTVDANTVTYNGNVIAAGDSYTIMEGLYAGNKVLVGYKVGNEFYAVGDTITLTEDIVLEAVTVDFTMMYGASIRLDATASIRFTAIINKADLAAVEALVGADNVSYGMVITAGENTYEINSKNANFQTGTYEDAYTLYSAVMTGIPASDYETELTAQAYIKVNGKTINSNLAEQKDGDAKASNVRSLADVAKAAYNDRNATKEGDYKYAVDGEFSPYTSAQLEEIAKYMPKAGE